MTRHRFTLLELLTVIAIIALLAGMLMPVLPLATTSAKKAKTRARIVNLQMATAQYQATYGFLPFTGAGADLLLDAARSQTLLATLSGNDLLLQPRGIRFLDLTNGGYADAWGQTLRVALDLDYSQSVADSVIYGAGQLDTDIAIWSAGPDGRDSATDTDAVNDDNITSWTD